MSQQQGLQGLYDYLVQTLYRLFSILALLLAHLLAFYYTIVLIARVSEDTTAITNVAFGILAILAALSFLCAMAVRESEEVKARFAFVGERYFHAGTLMLLASISKYASLSIQYISPAAKGIGIAVLSTAIDVIVPVLFLFALFSAQSGMVILNRLLWARFRRRKRFTRLYPP